MRCIDLYSFYRGIDLYSSFISISLAAAQSQYWLRWWWCDHLAIWLGKWQKRHCLLPHRSQTQIFLRLYSYKAIDMYALGHWDSDRVFACRRRCRCRRLPGCKVILIIIHCFCCSSCCSCCCCCPVFIVLWNRNSKLLGKILEVNLFVYKHFALLAFNTFSSGFSASHSRQP